MTWNVDQLLDSFKAELREKGEADPRPYLSRLQGAERAQLEALIDVALEHSADRRFDPERFAAWRESDRGRAALARVARATAPAEGLAQLRDAAKLPRSKLVSGLAEQLGLRDREPAVRLRYHQLESGLLEPAGVSAKVWDSLGQLLGRSAETVRAAAGAAGPATGGAVFARTATPTPEAGTAPPADAPPASGEKPDDPEVDALFLGPEG